MGEDQKTNTHWVLRHIKVWLNPGDENTFTNTVGLVSCLLWEHVAREKAADHTVHWNTQVSNLIEYPVRYCSFLQAFSTLPISVLKKGGPQIFNMQLLFFSHAVGNGSPGYAMAIAIKKILVCAKRILFWG